MGRAITQSNLRSWVQPGGAKQSNPRYFAGVDWSEVRISSTSSQRRQEGRRIARHDPYRPGDFVPRGFSHGAPGADNLTVGLAETCGGIPAHEMLRCGMTLYELHSCCGDPANFLTGWDRVRVYADVDMSSKAWGDRTSFEGDAELVTEVGAVARSIYDVAPLTFRTVLTSGAGNTTQVPVNAWAGRPNCASSASCDCMAYSMTNDGVLSVCRGGLWESYAVRPSADALVSDAFLLAEESVIVGLVSELPVAWNVYRGGYFVVPLNQQTGVPDVDGIRVHNLEFLPERAAPYRRGFVAYADQEQIYYVADSRSDPVLLFSVVGTPTAIKSLPRKDFVLVVTLSGYVTVWDRGVQRNVEFPPIATEGGTALEIIDEKTWWVGALDGRMFVTYDAGVSWREPAYQRVAGEDYVIQDIYFPTPEVGHALVWGGLSGVRMLTTWDGGYSWTDSAPRLQMPASMTPIDSLTPLDDSTRQRLLPFVCDGTDTEAANNLLVAGLLEGLVGAGGGVPVANSATLVRDPAAACEPFTICASGICSCDPLCG